MLRSSFRVVRNTFWVSLSIATWTALSTDSAATQPGVWEAVHTTERGHDSDSISSTSRSVYSESPANHDSWRRLPTTSRPRFRMAGEFERQRALMLSCSTISTAQGIRDAIRVAAHYVPILALYGTEDERQSAQDALTESGIRHDSIRFVFLPHDTIWTRDYGPVALSARAGGQTVLLDTQYPSGGRENDDLVPQAVARSTGLPISSVPWNIDGGNVLSNGQGLLITTTKLLKENPELDAQTLRKMLSEYYGATRVVILESLIDEPTGHVDMFATFTSSDCVVIGRYDPKDDPENAKILNRNARRLANVRLKSGSLRVRRLHMPSKEDGIWRTYTNVIYANRVLLMPVYSNTLARSREHAIRSYQTLLPGWSVVPINADELIAYGGALHCAIMNLGPMSPDLLEPDTSWRRPIRLSFNETDYLLK